MNFGIASLFENAAAEVRLPAKATCESLRCRAWYLPHMSFMKWRRCDAVKEQHDGTCWEHRDYYKGWWSRHVPTNDYTEDVMMSDQLEEIRFQIERGHVSLQDPELVAAMGRWIGCSLFFMFLCEYDQFDYATYPVHVSGIVYRLTNQVINRLKTYDQAFESLHRLFDRGYIFTHYLAHCLDWVNRNIYAGAANVVEGLLYTANVTFRDIAGKRQLLAESFKVMRSRHIASDAEDDRYNFCMGRYWMWVSRLKTAERAAYEPIREAVLAAAWAPVRMPFWCLDVEEVAEDYPEGLPSKEEWKVLCTSAATEVTV